MTYIIHTYVYVYIYIHTCKTVNILYIYIHRDILFFSMEISGMHAHQRASGLDEVHGELVLAEFGEFPLALPTVESGAPSMGSGSWDRYPPNGYVAYGV